MSSAQKKDDVVTPYHQEPPAWRPLLHPGSASLGVPDYHPPRPGQEEDQMSDTHVKHGMQAKQIISNESFS